MPQPEAFVPLPQAGWSWPAAPHMAPAGYVLIRIEPWDQLMATEPATRQYTLLTHLWGHVQTLFGPHYHAHRLSKNEFLLMIPGGNYACFTYQCHRLRLALQGIPLDPEQPVRVALSLCQRPPRQGWPYMLGRLRRLTQEPQRQGRFCLGVA